MEARLSDITRALDAESRKLRRWSYAWSGTYAAAAVTQTALLPFIHGGARTDLAVGAASAAFGSASLFLLPMRITGAGGKVHDLPQTLSPCERLAQAETLFRRAASDERLSGGVLAHGGNVVFNVGLGLLLGAGFGRWKSGIISAAVGTAVGETNLLTAPQGLPALWERYPAGPPVQLQLVPLAWPGGGGGAAALGTF